MTADAAPALVIDADNQEYTYDVDNDNKTSVLKLTADQMTQIKQTEGKDHITITCMISASSTKWLRGTEELLIYTPGICIRINIVILGIYASFFFLVCIQSHPLFCLMSYPFLGLKYCISIVIVGIFYDNQVQYNVCGNFTASGYIKHNFSNTILILLHFTIQCK